MSTRLEQLTQLHQADPTDPFCTYGIALEHAKASDRDEAIQWLDKTLELDAHYCYAFYQKARILFEHGDTEGARNVLESGMAAARSCNDEHALSEMDELLQTL